MLVQNPKILAAIVRSNRKKQRLSQAFAAARVGLKQSTLSAFETKPEATKLDTLFRILSAANLEIHISHKNKQDGPSSWPEEW
jgi:HTH-type transcriptional regulator / antitoxin HipB